MYNLWNSPSVGAALGNLLIGGYNPGIPTSNPISGGATGAATNAIIEGAMTNFSKAAVDEATGAVGWAKFAYDASSFAYAYVFGCS